MKIEDYFLRMVETYVYDEIDYICNEIEICKHNKNRKHEIESLEKDLKYLENLTINDMNKVVGDVLNESEFLGKINELIHYYLYYYKKEIKIWE